MCLIYFVKMSISFKLLLHPNYQKCYIFVDQFLFEGQVKSFNGINLAHHCPMLLETNWVGLKLWHFDYGGVEEVSEVQCKKQCQFQQLKVSLGRVKGYQIHHNVKRPATDPILYIIHFLFKICKSSAFQGPKRLFSCALNLEKLILVCKRCRK